MSNRLLVAHDYETLRQALNERRLALKMTLLDLDAKALLPDGYSGHVLGAGKFRTLPESDVRLLRLIQDARRFASHVQALEQQSTHK